MDTKISKKNQFDELAKSWDSNPKKVKFAEIIANSIICDVPLNIKMKAMELGCGTGLVTMGLAPKLHSIKALDTSQNMIEILNHKIDKNNIGNISTKKLDKKFSNNLDEKFSFIFSNMVMHHIKDVESLLKELYNSLSPDGYIAISDLDTEDGSFHGDMECIYHYGFSQDEFINSMEKAGFTNCRIRTAHVIKRENPEGDIIEYPVFLSVGQKKKI